MASSLKLKWVLSLSLSLHLLLHFSNLCEAKKFPSFASTSSWQNTYSASRWTFSDNTFVSPVLALYTDPDSYLDFGFGFLRNSTSNAFYLAVIKIPKQNESHHGTPPVILWCANRNRPVQSNATLEFTPTGDLVLTDVDGSVAWSTNNTGATNMSLDDGGNLRLKQSNGSVVWSSFEQPTDTWVPGQKLLRNQTLTSSVSASNLSSGMFYVKIGSTRMKAYVRNNHPQLYRSFSLREKFGIGSFDIAQDGVTYSSQSGDGFQYMRLDHEGHLNVYKSVDDGGSFQFLTDLLKDGHYGDCGYPTVCGNYGVCSDGGGNCSCPEGFKPVNPSDERSGCTELVHLSCRDAKLHKFVELENVSYFDFSPVLINTDASTCKNQCLKNCSCKAAFFRYNDNVSVGNCSFEFQKILSLKGTAKSVYGFVDIAFIKVQQERVNPWLVVALVAALSLFLLFLIFMSGSFRVYWKRRTKRLMKLKRMHNDEWIGDASSFQLPNQLRKFSFEELKSATNNFQNKLGEGGFGSVFEGTLKNCGTKVAVKHLIANIHQCKRSFVAEVKTIGAIHHINLVRLVGYCVEKSNRFLVYEYMCNGSLDTWIFHSERARYLTWDTLRRIIVGIAKGLEYLHDFCDKNIIHFDIKPQNILLNRDFNVKIADFGLARLVEKDESHVSTLPKGTYGYMAPELMKSGKDNITVKIDVYSLGIVILEMICGRRNSDNSYDSSLLEIVKTKAREDRLADLVNYRRIDHRSCKDEAVETLRIAICCLQPLSRRPTASMVVKMLEGLVEPEPFPDYEVLDPVQSTSTQDDIGNSLPPSDSVLSGPR